MKVKLKVTSTAGVRQTAIRGTHEVTPYTFVSCHTTVVRHQRVTYTVNSYDDDDVMGYADTADELVTSALTVEVTDNDLCPCLPLSLQYIHMLPVLSPQLGSRDIFRQ